MPSKRRPQGDGTIRKRSDGRWEGRIIIGHKKNGSPIFKSVFGKTQKSALKQLHLLIDLYRDVDLTEECRMTLSEWLDKWLDEYMVFTIKESTIDGYRKMINNQIKRFLGEKQLAYLTTADVQKSTITSNTTAERIFIPYMGMPYPIVWFATYTWYSTKRWTSL